MCLWCGRSGAILFSFLLDVGSLPTGVEALDFWLLLAQPVSLLCLVLVVYLFLVAFLQMLVDLALLPAAIWIWGGDLLCLS